MAARPKLQKATKTEFIQNMIHQYLKETGTSELVNMNALTEWFIARGYYQETRLSAFKRCKRAIGHAMAHDMFVDDRGNHVRRMHAVRRNDAEGQQYWEWAEIHAAKPEHMRLSLSQRRRDMEGRVRQHDVDRQYYNEHNRFGAELVSYDYNFNLDKQEDELAARHDGQYPDEKPED